MFAMVDIAYHGSTGVAANADAVASRLSENGLGGQAVLEQGG